MRRILLILVSIAVLLGSACVSTDSQPIPQLVGADATQVCNQLDDLAAELAKESPDMERVRSLVDSIRSDASVLEDRAWTMNAIIEALFAANGYYN